MSKAVVASILRAIASPHATLSQKVVHSWIIFSSRMRIMTGPFKGLHYVPQSSGSAYYPKLLGTYEKELESIVETIIARKPALIVDAGSAEGYFAVGLASRCPSAKVVAYDLEIRACYFLQMFAEGNGVRDRMEIHCKPCTWEDLSRDLEPHDRPFLLMDVEGAEGVLLDPDKVPSLAKTEILVELHTVPGEVSIPELLARRFSFTHEIKMIRSQKRHSQESPVSLIGFETVTGTVLNEGRQADQGWMHLVPKSWQTSGSSPG